MNIIKSKNKLVVAFIAVIVLGISLLFIFKPVLGIDFTGGALVEIKPAERMDIARVREVLNSAYTGSEPVVQSSGENQYIIRVKIEEGEFEAFNSKIKEAFANAEILRHENIGATVGKSLTQKAIYGVILASALIVVYMAYAFGSVPGSISSWTFGIIAVMALIHDLIFTLASYAVIGRFAGFEFEGIVIVAILTILGFSVHDTIVVFDRIRENIIKHPQLSIDKNVNNSINQTFSRSLNTSLTVIVVLISMLLLGGTTMRPFILVLIIGIGIGTYSSIFIASPLLVKYIEYTKR